MSLNFRKLLHSATAVGLCYVFAVPNGAFASFAEVYAAGQDAWYSTATSPLGACQAALVKNIQIADATYPQNAPFYGSIDAAHDGICFARGGNKWDLTNTYTFQFGYSKTCPPNSTDTNAMCTCNSGYYEDTAQSMCVPECTSPDQKRFPEYGNQCLTLVEVESKHKIPKSCLATGNPIYPMTGTKRETVDTGFSVGGKALLLVYDTIGRPNANLWNTNFHKSIAIPTTPTGPVVANRGAGEYIGLARSSSDVCGASIGVDDSVSKVGAALLYLDVNARTLETYDLSGNLAAVYGSTGDVTTTILSDATTPVNIAPAPGHLLKVTDTSGKSVSFEYVLPAGQPAANGAVISKITNSAGRSITLGYDAHWNLSTLTWPDATVRTFLYEDTANPWALTGVVDENNSRFATWTYAPTGQALSSEHAGGVERSVVDYAAGLPSAPTIREEVRGTYLCRFHETVSVPSLNIVGPNGKVSTASIDSSLGYPQLAGLSQPAGSGCAASNNASTFDAKGNITSRDHFDGTRSCYAYDAMNRETTRVEGLSNTVACSSVISTGATLPAGASKILTQWHADWKLPTVVTAPGSITTTVYHGQPDPFNNNAVANCTTAPSLPNGKPLPVVCKTVTQATLNGTVAATSIDPSLSSIALLLHGDGTNGSALITDSSVAQLAATAYGNAKISTAQSKFGGASMSFDGSTSHIGVAASPSLNFGANAFTVEAYVRWSALPAAGYGQFIVDRWDQPSDLSWALYYYNNQIGLAYSSNGTTGSTGVLGNFTPVVGTWYHIAVVRDANTIKIFLNGNVLASAPFTASIFGSSATKPTRVGAMYEWSANVHGLAGWFNGYVDELRITNGVARYTANFTPPAQAFYDGTSSYLDTSVPTETSQYTYDAAGRVLTSKDSLNRTTGYTYYTATSFTGIDPNAVGHTLGDLQSITDPQGFVTTFDLYDRSGRVLQMTDAKGVVTTMTYTPRGWISTVSVTPPAGAARVTTYTYDAVGQLTGVANPDGTTISYSYDAAHRLIGATDAKGNTVSYTLDNMGNRLAEQLKDPSGALQRSMSRSFDALNRVQQLQLH